MVTYNTVINALGRCGRVAEATVHLNAMKEQGLTPDIVTFGTLIHASAQGGRTEAALALFAELVVIKPFKCRLVSLCSSSLSFARLSFKSVLLVFVVRFFLCVGVLLSPVCVFSSFLQRCPCFFFLSQSSVSC